MPKHGLTRLLDMLNEIPSTPMSHVVLQRPQAKVLESKDRAKKLAWWEIKQWTPRSLVDYSLALFDESWTFDLRKGFRFEYPLAWKCRTGELFPVSHVAKLIAI